jgi:hypothetical protein
MMTEQSQPHHGTSRRRLIAGAGGLTIGAATLVALAGCTSVEAVAPKNRTASDDAAVLNNMLGLEYETIAAYDAALAGGALAAAEAAMARAFQSDHAKHAEALMHAVLRLQGKPVAPLSPIDYRFSPAALARRDEAMRLLAGFEQGLALAHLGAVPAFADKNLAKDAAGILGIETMHWGALRRALGEDPVPAPFLG